MSPPKEPETKADLAESLIRDAILQGNFSPDERLTLPKLSKRFDIGVTPIREALSRLLSHGLVTSSGNKGFRVSELSPTDAREAVRAAITMEISALRLSIAQRDPNWEDNVVIALHHLKKVIRSSAGDPHWGARNDYFSAHWNFHRALVAGCGSNMLLEARDTILERAIRHWRARKVNIPSDPEAFIKEHERLADRALLSTMDEAVSEMSRHMRVFLRILDKAESDSLARVLDISDL